MVARKRCGPTGSVLTLAASTSRVSARYPWTPIVIVPASAASASSSRAKSARTPPPAHRPPRTLAHAARKSAAPTRSKQTPTMTRVLGMN